MCTLTGTTSEGSLTSRLVVLAKAASLDAREGCNTNTCLGVATLPGEERFSPPWRSHQKPPGVAIKIRGAALPSVAILPTIRTLFSHCYYN